MEAENATEFVAQLDVLNYQKLLLGDEVETSSLCNACVQSGFFYLELGDDPEMASYLDVIAKLFDFSQEYFSRPLETKMRDTQNDLRAFNICGYKPMGLDLGTVKDKKDGCEGLRIPIDLYYRPQNHPNLGIPGVVDDWPVITRFIDHSYEMTITLLRRLSESLELRDCNTLQSKHESNSSSTSTAVMQCYPLKNLSSDIAVGHFAHTDAGSISVLYCSDWGLQVYAPIHDRWEYVPPRKNCAIVNVGDTLKFLTQGRLQSSLHRVVPCYEHWRTKPRYSIIFFLRPNDNVIFEDSEGNTWSAGDWLYRKFGNYRRSHLEQQQTTMSTGKKGFSGLWEVSKPWATATS